MSYPARFRNWTLQAQRTYDVLIFAPMRVPRKNISRWISDVKRPREEAGEAPGADSREPAISVYQLAHVSRHDRAQEVRGKPHFPPPPRWFIARAWTAVGAAFALIVIVGGALFLQFRSYKKDIAPELLRSPATAPDAKPPSSFSELWGRFAPVLKNIGRTYREFGELSTQGVRLAAATERLKHVGPALFMGGHGEEFVALLREVRAAVASTSAALGPLSETSETKGEEFSLPFGGGLLGAQLELTQSIQFLDVLIPWLTKSGERRIAVFLENPAELRPTGGFWGSYAEAVIADGALVNLTVRDINEVDRAFEERIVPPQPLQAVETRWRIADANWFFDFPTSAEKTLSLMERSRLYRDRGFSFDGAVALSPRVIRDVLSLTGPLELPEYRVILDENNFWREVQNFVRRAEERGSKDSKKILKDASPLLLERISSLSGEAWEELAVRAEAWKEQKDVRVYLKEPALQKFFRSRGLAGEVYALPADWNGDYLAVVAANVGGGKSDFFMKRDIILSSQISEAGIVTNHLAINRVHGGNKARERWYGAENRSYLKVFTPPGAMPAGLSGAWERTIVPPVRYAELGYAADPEVSSIEKTAERSLNYPALTVSTEAGKKVFGFWSRVNAGATSRITLDYTHRLASLPRDGGTYQFVFEKQPGAVGSYRFELNAPVGFRWRENGLPLYEYVSDDPPGRMVLMLTFEKL